MRIVEIPTSVWWCDNCNLRKHESLTMKKGENQEYNCFTNNWDCEDFDCPNYFLCEAWEKQAKKREV